MQTAIIVEGKNDKGQLKKILNDHIEIHCTFGTPGTSQLERLAIRLKNAEIYIFTDNDSSGKRIRGMLRDYFPDAIHIYTRKGYKGVEKTPLEYLSSQIEKAGLGEYLLTASSKPAIWNKDEF